MSNNKKKKLVLAYYLYKKKQKEIEKRKRSSWVHPILLEREKYGAFQTLFTKLEEDETKFYNYFRMKKETFQLLLTAIYDKIRHEDTDMRQSISPAERLAVTLRYVKDIDIYVLLDYACSTLTLFNSGVLHAVHLTLVWFWGLPVLIQTKFSR